MGDDPIRFTVYMKQQNLDELRATFHSVSDPQSPSYGQFLTKADVDNLVRTSPEAVAAVSAWLADHDIMQPSVDVRADTLVVHTNCGNASRLLAVPFYHYEHLSWEHGNSDHSQPLFFGAATIPQELDEHIDFIGGISELWNGKLRRPRAMPHVGVGSSAAVDFNVTPKLLRHYYNVPEDETNVSPERNYQAVVAFDDYFSEGALTQFYATTDGGLGSPPHVDVMGIDCLNDPKPCDQVESDLDVQYMTAMAGRGTVKTLFHNANTSDGWVLGFTENALQLSPLPMVFSISYGWAELKQCDLSIEVCSKLGYETKQYVDRTNTNFQKLAVMGASVLVSDGDDGAQSVQPAGWDPLDMSHWCGGDSSWTCYPKTSSKCGEVVLHNITTGDKCVYPVGHMSDECSWLFLGDFYQSDTIEKALKAANPSCHLDFFLDGSYNSHMYSECPCEALQPISHRGVVTEVLSLDVDATKRIFMPDFPTSSPFVTSVGATVFKGTDGTSVNSEHAASIKDGAIITTGGGFSAMADTPSWQVEAVNAYNSGSAPKPPSGTYDSTKRGYPDITLNGHNYQVYSAKDNGVQCPCEVDGVDGTSASAPATAGLISMINGHRLAAGQSPLGFLNPLLYRAHTADPSIFNDVTVGDNACTRDYCMVYGFTAGNGWDPVAGLGSLNYVKLKEYALSSTGLGTPKEVFV